MKVILDEGVPEGLARYLPDHDVTSVGRLNWKGTRNGKLLRAIESAGFEVFITNDKRMEYEQNLMRRPFTVLLLSTNHWPTLEPHVENIAAAINEFKPKTVTRVDCGKFVPRKCRKPNP